MQLMTNHWNEEDNQRLKWSFQAHMRISNSIFNLQSWFGSLYNELHKAWLCYFQSLLSATCLMIKHRESDQSKGNHTTSTPSHNMPNHDSCILNSQSFFVFFLFFWLFCWGGLVGVESCHLSQNSLAQKKGGQKCVLWC